MPELEFHAGLTQETWLCDWFGRLGREIGTPNRFYTNNPNDLMLKLKECAEQKLPCFLSVQPYSTYDKPCAIEKLYFEFDVAKEDEMKKRAKEGKPITEEELVKRKIELEFELHTWLRKLSFEGRRIIPFIVKTRRGYHVYIFLSKIFQFESRHVEFAKKVYEKLCRTFMNIIPLVYMDDHSTNIKQLARVPTSIHQKSGEVCIVVNENLEQTKIRSLDYYKLYGILESEVKRTIELVKREEELQKQAEKERKEREPKSEGWNHVRQGKIRPCFLKALEVGEASHQQRLALLLEAYCSGIKTVETMIDLFRKFHDFDEKICRTQVEWFFQRLVQPALDQGKEIKPYRCRTIFEKGWCLREECPLYKGE